MSLIDPKNKTKQKGNQLPMRIQNSRPSGRRMYTSFPLGQKVLRDKSLRWVKRLLKFRMPELGSILRRKCFTLQSNVDLFVIIGSFISHSLR